MTTEPIEIFYSYAHEDEQLQIKLNEHLAHLQRQELISAWHDHKITAGSLWKDEIDKHLYSARIILLLVSHSFISSDYCYGIEMQTALKCHESGDSRVIPIILRPCDWESTPFGKLEALPKKAKPVTMWSNRDAAFTDIAKGIRKVIGELTEESQATSLDTSKASEKIAKVGKKIGGKEQMDTIPTDITQLQATPTVIGTSALKPAIKRYYKTLEEIQAHADYEMALRDAFRTLLYETGRMVNCTLISEQTIEGKIRPDGVLRNSFNLKRGIWEAKGPKSNLEKEIQQKIATGYPLNNAIFENTKKAILFQGGKKNSHEYNLEDPKEIAFLLRDFLNYVEPDVANFETAVTEFKGQIPDLAKGLLDIIAKEHKLNNKYRAAFVEFKQLCETTLDPKITDATINDMLVQHLMTERLFRTVFENPDFVNRNVIAAEIEKVIQALASREFNRTKFLNSLDRFYKAIEDAAKNITSWSEKQNFLNVVYERFFQGFSVKQADTHGIVYTPQEIVDFMCASVDEVLKKEFGTSIAEPGVKILDPATGTGNFIVNLIRNYIPRHRLKEKYANDLFCNEIMLLPYYIASLNIEHEYYEKMGQYEPFEGICFADTLELAEGQQLSLFVEENTERVRREKEADIMVVVGNPPYNVGQKSENDNNKNRQYNLIDKRIRETYVKDSNATLKTQLYDAYVRFFRWAADRLQGRDGIVCYVSNNSFIQKFAFDGMRKHLLKDFTQIYHLDLHGSVNDNPKLSGTIHNIFGIKVGVGITLAIKNSQHNKKSIFYHRLHELWRRTEKISFLAENRSISNINWKELQPDERQSWINEGLKPEFLTFLSIGIKEINGPSLYGETTAIFTHYSGGAKTNRDIWVYDFDSHTLSQKVKIFIDTYNTDIDRWKRRGNSNVDLNSFVTYNDQFIKWSEHLKKQLIREKYAKFEEQNIRNSLNRVYTKQFLYFDPILNDRRLLQYLFFPTPDKEYENRIICVPGIGNRKDFGCIATNIIPKLDLAFENAQTFPFYTYAEDGTNRRENITDWSLQQFQTKYGPSVTKWDIFHYIYAILHHPQYRSRYAENLKRDLPHIPLLHNGGGGIFIYANVPNWQGSYGSAYQLRAGSRAPFSRAA